MSAEQNGRYSLKELMICAAAHLLEDNKIAVIGVGMPLAAAMLAQKISAPNLVIMFEGGSFAPILEKLQKARNDDLVEFAAARGKVLGRTMP